MDFKWRRSVLIGGVGLSLSLWLLDSLHHTIANLGIVTPSIVLVGAVGAGLWFSRQRPLPPVQPRRLALVERGMVERAIDQVRHALTQLETEAATNYPALHQQVADLTAELDRSDLRLAVLGGQAVGKTTLLSALQGAVQTPTQCALHWQDTSPLFTPATDGESIAAELPADLTLFVIAGDLTQPELQVLHQIVAAPQRVVLVVNKQDQWLPHEQAIVLQQIHDRVKDVMSLEDVVSIAALPRPTKVRQHQPDGSIQESLETPTAILAPLIQRLQQILIQEGQSLVWTRVLRQTYQLRSEVQMTLNVVRRDRALPLIEQFQWIAATTAFANPVPALDLLAATAINGQLILDLGAIYQQTFSLQQAKVAAGAIGKLLFQLGVVELSTQAIGVVLKSHFVTFVAGGVLQGMSAAYLTRLVGLSLIEYFEEQSLSGSEQPAAASLNLGRLAEKLQAVFQDNQRLAVLQGFVQMGMAKLSSVPQLASVEAILPESVS